MACNELYFYGESETASSIKQVVVESEEQHKRISLLLRKGTRDTPQGEKRLLSLFCFNIDDEWAYKEHMHDHIQGFSFPCISKP